MIIKRHQKGDAASVAAYSDCEQYRYSLTRMWQKDGRKALFILLNPSTATEMQNDPTVERCERRARALGFGAFAVTNIFAYRATNPLHMRTQVDPVGPGNDGAIADRVDWADHIICGWGSHGAHLARGAQVAGLLRAMNRPLFHLGLTQSGQPKHPLYVGYAVQPVVWGDGTDLPPV